MWSIYVSLQQSANSVKYLRLTPTISQQCEVFTSHSDNQPTVWSIYLPLQQSANSVKYLRLTPTISQQCEVFTSHSDNQPTVWSIYLPLQQSANSVKYLRLTPTISQQCEVFTSHSDNQPTVWSIYLPLQQSANSVKYLPLTPTISQQRKVFSCDFWDLDWSWSNFKWMEKAPSHIFFALSHVMRLWYFLSSVNTFIFQTRSHSHPMEPDVRFLVGPFFYFRTSCVRTAKGLTRLRKCAGSPEPLLVAFVISISWAGSIYFSFFNNIFWICYWMVGWLHGLSSFSTKHEGLNCFQGSVQLENCFGLKEMDTRTCSPVIWRMIGLTIWATSWENLLMPYANNKGTDQPAHLRSLISAFVICCLDSIILLVSILEISSLYIAFVAAQAGLSLPWSQIPEDRFSRDEAHLAIVCPFQQYISYIRTTGW